MTEAETEIEAAHETLDSRGAPVLISGHKPTLSERINMVANDFADRVELWDDCVKGHLMAKGLITEDDWKAAQDWAGHVASK